MAVIRRRSADRPDRQPMVARVDHGMIRLDGLSRRGPQMSATPDSTLTDPQQIIADLQRKLNEAEAERDGALAQQTATAEVLGVINSSPGDLVPVFDAILEKAHTLCSAPLGSLVLCDGEQLRAVATRGYPQEYQAMGRQGFSPIR